MKIVVQNKNRMFFIYNSIMQKQAIGYKYKIVKIK